MCGKVSNSTSVKLRYCSLSDLLKLYSSPLMYPDASPATLQTKVQFHIRYYICHRGAENIKNMTQDTFELVFDTESLILRQGVLMLKRRKMK